MDIPFRSFLSLSVFSFYFEGQNNKKSVNRYYRVQTQLETNYPTFRL